jgi:hypothetical protein
MILKIKLRESIIKGSVYMWDIGILIGIIFYMIIALLFLGWKALSIFVLGIVVLFMSFLLLKTYKYYGLIRVKIRLILALNNYINEYKNTKSGGF